MIRIIDNKKIDLTNSEYKMYKNIANSYTRDNMNGEDLFHDLFETNDSGLIVYLKPPSKRQTSFEVFLFLMTIFQHQHMREMYSELEDFKNKLKEDVLKLLSKKE